MKIRLGKPGRKNRANNVHIDNFDVWSLDHTLSCIIHPALIRLKETKHGYPELFEDGMVTPNHAIGGSTNIVVNVDASGSSVEGDEEQGRELGRLISVAVQSELIQQKRPGGLLA